MCVCVYTPDCISRGDIPINPIILMKCFPTRGCCVAAEDRCPARFGCTLIVFALTDSQVAACNGPYKISSVSAELLFGQFVFIIVLRFPAPTPAGFLTAGSNTVWYIAFKKWLK